MGVAGLKAAVRGADDGAAAGGRWARHGRRGWLPHSFRAGAMSNFESLFVSAGFLGLMTAVAAAAWMGGMAIGRARGPVTWLALAGAGLAVLGWGLLVRHPELGVRWLPASVLGRLEGVALVPVLMGVAGVVWSRLDGGLRRRAMLPATAFAVLLLVHGGGWMVEPGPTLAVGHAVPAGHVQQTEGYSCAAAASATLLQRVGVEATEQEMAVLTGTRVGAGTTVLRTVVGLQRKLAGTGLRVRLSGLPDGDLADLPVPVMMPLRQADGGQHMVTVLGVEEGTVVVADPMQVQPVRLGEAEFRRAYAGPVVAVVSRGAMD